MPMKASETIAHILTSKASQILPQLLECQSHPQITTETIFLSLMLTCTRENYETQAIICISRVGVEGGELFEP